jgi:hypothetical protein
LLPDLLEFQREFAAALDHPANGAMALYRSTVLHGAVEALRSNYPVVEQIVGTEMFEQVAIDFASTCPPKTPVLALYGEEFADWLTNQAWIGDVPYLPDIARVERLHLECLFAPDPEPVAQPERSFDPSGLALRLHSAVRFLWLSTPAMTIWLAHQQPLASAIEPEWAAEGALFTRPDPFTIVPALIDRAAHRLLFGLLLGESLGHSLRATEALYPDTDFQALVTRLIALGAFAPLFPERRS